MSAPKSSKKKQSHTPAADVDVDMSEERDEVPEWATNPSTKIGSYLSENYNHEVESKKTPGFICGQCYCLNTLKARESIRCRECGYRIMYKERLRRPMEYSAQ